MNTAPTPSRTKIRRAGTLFITIGWVTIAVLATIQATPSSRTAPGASTPSVLGSTLISATATSEIPVLDESENGEAVPGDAPAESPADEPGTAPAAAPGVETDPVVNPIAVPDDDIEWQSFPNHSTRNAILAVATIATAAAIGVRRWKAR